MRRRLRKNIGDASAWTTETSEDTSVEIVLLDAQLEVIETGSARVSYSPATTGLRSSLAWSDV